MAYTQEQLTALETAVAKGEKRVTFGDKSVEYRTVEELQAAIEAVKRDLHDQAVATGFEADADGLEVVGGTDIEAGRHQ